MARMRIAVTGATGFVGRAATRLLAERGHELSVLVRDLSRQDGAPSTKVVAGDLFNKIALAELVSGSDAVLHLAGAIKAHGSEAFFAVNRDGTANLAAAAVAGGVKRFIHVSSLAAREPSLSPYAASKHAAEQAITRHASDIRTLILRPAAVYGPGDKATLPLLKALMSPFAVLPGKRDQRFSLIHVDDLAAVLCDAVESEKTGLLEVDDLDGGHGWDDLLATTRQAFDLPKRAMYLPYPIASVAGGAADLWSGLSGRAMMVSRGKMRELYHPDWAVRGANWPRSKPVSLAEGLPRTVRWYQAEGLLPHIPGKDGTDEDPLNV